MGNVEQLRAAPLLGNQHPACAVDVVVHRRCRSGRISRRDAIENGAMLADDVLGRSRSPDCRIASRDNEIPKLVDEFLEATVI